MKPLITFLFLLPSVFAFCQTDEIVRILNRELQNEIRTQKEDTLNYQGEKFEVLKKFSVKDSVLQVVTIKADGTEDALVQTTMKILSLEVRKKNYYGKDFYTEKQEVDLSNIKAVIKDINIIFETEPDAVTITRTDENGEKNVFAKNLFFLQLCYEKQNEHLASELISAFEKAGCEIKKGSWYD
ncbi:hypothetical protein [Pedobacter nanyangensis]|uniref:hypothetical protein n=1 Tax=Pedobacter nanyangensis TaxID=1562389 RepID=UPI000DE32778|nr:hypothetical protein [Pedobacter nanyangensis]